MTGGITADDKIIKPSAEDSFPLDGAEAALSVMSSAELSPHFTEASFMQPSV
jgi:hypothetical protein